MFSVHFDFSLKGIFVTTLILLPLQTSELQNTDKCRRFDKYLMSVSNLNHSGEHLVVPYQGFTADIV